MRRTQMEKGRLGENKVEQIKEVRRGGRPVAFSNTNLCNFVGKWKELHCRQIDGTNFPALDQLERLQQQPEGGSLFQMTRCHFSLKSGLQQQTMGKKVAK